MKQKKFYLSIVLFSLTPFLQQSFAQVTQATMQQIQLLLKEKSSRSPLQQKIDSRLLQAIRESQGQKMADGVNLESAKVADATGNLKVDIKANVTPALLSKITSLGGTIIYSAPGYNAVRATVNLKIVEAIAAGSDVKFIKPAEKYMLEDVSVETAHQQNTMADRIATVRAKLIAYLQTEHPLAGKVTSEGDATHRADDVRSTYGYQGQGIKIGVLSDSYNAKNGASTNVTNGDLPGTGNPDGDLTPVTVVQDFAGGSDEGRAMLQVIHDLAPKAQLYFATADNSEESFADNIKTLRLTYGCNVIVDDVFYFDEPVFQDGIVARAVDTVTRAGALYFSSAGNAGSVLKGTAGVFEGDFNDAGSLGFTGGAKAGTIHNFGTTATPVNGDIVKTIGLGYNMNWSDPWGASANDYDLFLISSSGVIKASSTNIQNGDDDPYEEIDPPSLASGDRLVVFKTSGAAKRAFHLNTNRGTLTVATSGQTKGHSCAQNAFSTAATPAAGAFSSSAPDGPYPNPFVSSNKVETFSSDGPRRKFYNENGTPVTSGNLLFSTSGGVLLAKPDITAADGTKTTFSLLSGLNPFYGTSCAAPHAAAIAALVLSGNPSLTTTQVRSILTSTALDIEGAGYDYNSGYGILQAFQAAGQVNVTCNSSYDNSTHNTFASAVLIPFNTNITGTIAASGEVDYYKFKIKTSGTATITLTTLPADYDLYIYNGKQVVVAKSVKTGTASETVSKTFAAGNFYIKVIGKNASAVNATSCYTLNITPGTATRASENNAIADLSDDNLHLSPNPATSVLNVALPKISAGGTIKIVDINGKSISNQKIISTTANIDVSRFTSGTYLLIVVNKDGSLAATSKFIKQ